MSKQEPVSIVAISKLLDEKFKINNKIVLSAFDRDIKLLESRVGSLENKVDALKETMNKRFDDNDDAHQELVNLLDNAVNEKMQKHCQQSHFAAV